MGSLGGTPHTSYSAAKFAVKGFSEALIDDLRVNAPHVDVSVVMPGHIGTSIAENTGKIIGGIKTEEDLEKVKENMIKMGMPVHNFTPEQIKQQIKKMLRRLKITHQQHQLKQLSYFISSKEETVEDFGR